MLEVEREFSAPCKNTFWANEVSAASVEIITFVTFLPGTVPRAKGEKKNTNGI